MQLAAGVFQFSFFATASSGRFSVFIARYGEQPAFFRFYCPLLRAAGVVHFLFPATTGSSCFSVFIARYSEQRACFSFYCPLQRALGVFHFFLHNRLKNVKMVLVYKKIFSRHRHSPTRPHCR